MSKLAIAAETEEDRFDTTVKVECYACRDSDVDQSLGELPTVIDGVMKALTFSHREEVKAWEQEFVPCEHTLCVQQEPNRPIKPEGTNNSEHSEIPWPACSAYCPRSKTLFDVRP
jgi:ubiquitin carboxyl-terminal hydrolase 5/13